MPASLTSRGVTFASSVGGASSSAYGATGLGHVSASAPASPVEGDVFHQISTLRSAHGTEVKALEAEVRAYRQRCEDAEARLEAMEGACCVV